LTALAATLDGLACHSMRVKEWQGDIVFLHEVVPGSADRSYGLHVAKLAGLPAAVVARAERVLEGLETGDKAKAVASLADDLPLFSAMASIPAAAGPAPEGASGPSPADEMLAEVNPDALTPREALDLIYRLKSYDG
jgi:DNA mismatch repair protein MutS